MALKKKKPDHPKCPECQKSMIVIAGYQKHPELRTCECLRCGYVGRPAMVRRADAAE
jgi:hypothetical protein